MSGEGHLYEAAHTCEAEDQGTQIFGVDVFAEDGAGELVTVEDQVSVTVAPDVPLTAWPLAVILALAAVLMLRRRSQAPILDAKV